MPADRRDPRAVARRLRDRLVTSRGRGAATGVDERSIRALVDLLRSGATLRRALESWHLHAPEPAVSGLRSVSHRLRLGAAPGDALAAADFLAPEDRAALQTAVDTHVEHGGDLASVLSSLARSMEVRAARRATARAAVAGVLTSGRLVSGLPFLVLLALPSAHVNLLDPLGAATMVAGLALAWTGMRWMARLVPEPAREDVRARLAEDLATLLDAGLPLAAALQATCDHAPVPLGDELLRAGRRAALGAPWPAALLASGDAGLVRIGRTLERSAELGVPGSAPLRALAGSLREEEGTRFEAELRRAPVLMVVPLVICVLPAFGLVGLVPFLRGISFG